MVTFTKTSFETEDFPTNASLMQTYKGKNAYTVKNNILNKYKGIINTVEIVVYGGTPIRYAGIRQDRIRIFVDCGNCTKIRGIERG